MSENPLGKTTKYINQYAPALLFAIARCEKRDELDSQYLGFKGQDIWNAYEISWLNANGLPQVAIGEFRVSAESKFIVESKSLKLYLNSFNQTKFESKQAVEDIIARDLSLVAAKAVDVLLFSPDDFNRFQVETLTGDLIDASQVKIEQFSYQPEILADCNDNSTIVSEKLVSHLLKSNCLITSQPDWASIQISYQGAKIDRDCLLKYLISFRSHNEFHEQCVERIYSDIKKFCQPEKLTVYARYTRRGGLDINPWRSDFETEVPNLRLARQ